MNLVASMRLVQQCRQIACLCLWLSWIAFFSPATHAATWAILTSRGLDVEKNAVDLMTAGLLGVPGIELVERADVQSLLREQQLSAFGDETDSLFLGSLLEVDGFAIWEGQTDQVDRQTGRLICFDGKTGVRLTDQVLTGNRLEDLTTRAKDAIQEAARKREAVDRRDLILMSISSVRDSLPEQLKSEIPGAVEELERTLIGQPDLVLLERERLRFVLQEKMLPIARAQAHLLSAAQSVTVEFSRRPGDKLGATLRIHHPLDSLPIEITWDLEPGHRDEFLQRLKRSLEDRDARLKTLPRRDLNQLNHEASLLEKDGLRLDSIGAPLAAAVRWEAAYLLTPHSMHLRRLEMSLSGALSDAFLDRKTSTRHLHGRMHGTDGRRSPRPEDVAPAPEEMWLRALEIAEYRLSVQERLNDVPPHNELLGVTFFLANFPYLKPDHHSRAISRAQAYLDREEAFMLKRVETFEPNPKRNLTDAERRASAASLRFQLYCMAGRHLTSDWTPGFLNRIREVDPGDERIPEDSFTREALIELNEAHREKFFDIAGTEFSPPRGELPLSYRVAQLWLDARHGDEDRKRTLGNRAEQFVADVTDMLVSPERTSNPRHLEIVMTAGPVRVPSYQAYGQEWIMMALGMRTPTRHSNLRLATVRRLLDHEVVPAQLVLSLNPQAPAERELMQTAVKVLAGERSQYDAESRKNLTRTLKERLGDIVVAPVVNLESRMTQVFPVSSRQTKGSEVIHACRSPIGIVVFTRRHNDAKSSWLTEAHVLNGTSSRLLGTFAFPDEAVSSAEAKLKGLTFREVHRPKNFFDQLIPSAVPQVNDDYFLLPTALGGIVVYPRSGLPAFVLDESAGLPSNFVQSLAVRGNTLYAWLGPQGMSASLVAIDLTSRKLRVLVSTAQEAQATPLSNFPTGQCFGMVLSSDGDSLDMLMSGWGWEERCGLWRMDLKSGQIRSVKTGKFLTTWMIQTGDSLIFDKHGLLFGKEYGPSGQRFDDIVTVDSTTLQAKESVRPEDVKNTPLPLTRDADRRVWVYPLSEHVIEERCLTGEFARFQLMSRKGDERMRWCEISRDGDEMLWYSNQRVWTARWSTLVP